MTLTELDRVRFARHLLLPEIGAAGQERLLAARVGVAEGADSGALEVARDYLERAGVSVRAATPDAGAAEHAPAVGVEEAQLQVLSGPELRAMAAAPQLLEAARVLGGALAAVETIKAVLGLGEPSPPAPPFLLSEEA